MARADGTGLWRVSAHCNPLIDENVRSAFHPPDSWRLAAQMPLGSVEKPADPHADTPLEQRVRVFGSQA